MFKFQYVLVLLLLVGAACKNEQTNKTTVTQTTENLTDGASDKTEIKIIPISHATMVLQIDGTIIYVDPVGGEQAFTGQPKADLILVTDFHGDHLSTETLAAVGDKAVNIILPKDCADRLPEGFEVPLVTLANGEIHQTDTQISIEAIPMYNLREEDKNKHVKGRGNGYVVEYKGQRIYISGDTEDIPEMRALKNIDIAFVCMNLPYTMTVQAAADAVLEFAPKTVYPYHYRGANGLSDVAKFKSLVNAGNKDITVTQLDWYAQ